MGSFNDAALLLLVLSNSAAIAGEVRTSYVSTSPTRPCTPPPKTGRVDVDDDAIVKREGPRPGTVGCESAAGKRDGYASK